MSEHIHPGPHPDADQLNAFIEGVLPEHERLSSLAHLAECSRCRQLVFLAQEPAPVLAAAKTAPVWRSWFRLVPVFSAALAGVVLVAVFLHLHHAAKAPATNEVSTVEPPQPLVAPAPIQQPSAPPKTTSQKPAAKQAPVAQSQQTVATQEARTQAPSSTVAGVASISSTLQTDVLRYQTKPSSGQGSGQGLGQSSESAASNQAEAKKSPIINGRLATPDTNAYASGADIAAAPAAAPPPSQQAQLQQPAIAGRSANRNFAMAPSFLSRGPLRLRIEHNHGLAGNLSEVSGSVIDPSGAAVSGATVTLRRPTEAFGNKTTTNADGGFTLAAVPAGQYEVQIAAPGFLTLSQQVELQPRDLALLSPVLPIGAASATVELSSDTAEMDTKSQNIGGLVSAARMKRDHALPGKPPTVTSLSIGDRTLALDSARTLFLSRDGGKHWQAIKPVWQGQVSQLTLLPAPVSATEALDASADSAAGRSSVSQKSFQLTTDDHVVWISEDGIHWRLR
jgi:hypothetical protein